MPLLPATGATPPTPQFYRDFRPVELPRNTANSPVIPTPGPVSVIYEGFDLELERPGKRRNRAQPEPAVRALEIKPPPVKDSGSSTLGIKGRSIRGVASWYCSESQPVCHYQYPPGSMVAAACGKLRAAYPNWRGKTVTVTRGSRSVNVKLVDYCAHSTRVLDLYYEPMSQLGGTGLLNVTVSW